MGSPRAYGQPLPRAIRPVHLSGAADHVAARSRMNWRFALWVTGNLVLFAGLFQLYKLVRLTFIQRGEVVGYAHAEQVISLQQRLRLFFEPDVQTIVLKHDWLITGLAWHYAGFMWAFYACCVVAMWLAPVKYAFWRRVFLLSMLLALPWYALYPLAPPRFMTEYGFVDALKLYGPTVTGDEGGLVMANQYAAMPSMHVGWTTIGGCMIAAALPWRRTGLAAGTAIAGVMAFTVIATGNHYWLDAVGGWAVVLAAIGVARLLPTPLLPAWRFRFERQSLRRENAT